MGQPTPHPDTRRQMPGAAVVASTSVLAIGQRFGGYRIVRRLGEGGMGEVFLAHDVEGRLVALKVPKFDRNDADGRKRFAREAATAGALDHPNICPVRQVGEIDGQPFLEMEYIDGPPLSAFCAPEKLLKPQQVAFVLRRLALGLAVAHEHGIVHRDLKPGNLILRKSGEPVVTDFGLARSMNPDATRVTQSGMVVGSPAYMSPEQVDGESGAIGPASDIYSLGVVLFEMLTGHVPFEGAVGRILVKVLTEPPPRPSSLRAGVDPMLETLCLKMLEKRPSDRCGSMAEIAETLHAHFTRAPAASPPRLSTGAAREGRSAETGGGPRPTVVARAGLNAEASSADPSNAELATLSSLVEQHRRTSRMAFWSNRRYLGMPLEIAAVGVLAAVGVIVLGGTLWWRSANPGTRERNVAVARESARIGEAGDDGERVDSTADSSGATPSQGDPSSPTKASGALDVGGKGAAPAGLVIESYSGVDFDGGFNFRMTTDRINTETTTVGRSSRRWTGCLTPPTAGLYTLQMRGDDGTRVWLDGTLVLDDWRGRQADPPLECRVNLKQRAYWLQVDHFESGVGSSTWVLSWRKEGGLMQPIPAGAFTQAPESADDCNRVAWFLATTFDARVRNGRRAVEIATRANERTDWVSPQYLDTLAAALAENGDFEEAARRQSEALKLVSASDRDDYARRLARYQSRAPHRSSVTSLRLDPPPLGAGTASVATPSVPVTTTPSSPIPRPSASATSPRQSNPLPAPVLKSPAAGAVLTSSPKTARCLWEAVSGAASYRIEVQKQIKQKWTFQFTSPVSGTSHNFGVSDTQLTRWRVTAIDASGRAGVPSDWRTFRFSR